MWLLWAAPARAPHRSDRQASSRRPSILSPPGSSAAGGRAQRGGPGTPPAPSRSGRARGPVRPHLDATITAVTTMPSQTLGWESAKNSRPVSDHTSRTPRPVRRRVPARTRCGVCWPASGRRPAPAARRGRPRRTPARPRCGPGRGVALHVGNRQVGRPAWPRRSPIPAGIENRATRPQERLAVGPAPAGRERQQRNRGCRR